MSNPHSVSKRLLITTPDETTWDRKKPLLLLGEWCRLYNRSDSLAGLDIELYPYHWDDRQKYAVDYGLLENIYERKLEELSTLLGRMHSVSTNTRYWRIIVGSWLRFFIDALYDRFELIRTVAETGSVDDTLIHTYSLEDWVPSDFQEFYDQFRFDPWNHIIFAECIIEMGLSHSGTSIQLVPVKTQPQARSLTSRIRRGILNIYHALVPRRFNRIAIIDAYMPVGKLVQLQRSIGQLPYISNAIIKVENRKISRSKRASLKLDTGETAFERLLNRLIPQFVPLSYVENFSTLQKKSLAVFPSHPKLIFTANAYQGNDGFKTWAAHYTQNNVPLVIEQHGGHFGIGLLNQTEDHQLRIADIFASWGWISNLHKNVYPLPAMKLDADTIKHDPNGDILVITASYPRYFYCYFSVPVAGQVLDYLQGHVRFSKMLDPILAPSLKIRTDADIFGWEMHNRLNGAGLEEAIDNVQVGIMKRLKGCRIAVSTYNATVFLETLNANFPTLVFFGPDKYEVRADAQPMIDSLRKVGILHDSPESAAVFLNTIGSEISSWWNEEVLQVTRKTFCRSYAYASEEWTEIWAEFLNTSLKDMQDKSHMVAE